MKNSFLMILLGFILLPSCKSQTEESSSISETIVAQNAIHLVDVATFKTAITAENVQLIDVRTPEEYAEGHIENAKLINFMADDFSTAILKANKDQPVYIYCRSGTRSGKAAKRMKELGFKSIYDLDGGFKAWEAN